MEFLTTNIAPIMFGGLILFLLMGFPVAFSLGACGLFSVSSVCGSGCCRKH